LPIFINDEELLDAPPPVLSSDGNTVLVPFREIFRTGIGFVNNASLSAEGSLSFGGSGAGSETNIWQVGDVYVRGMGWRVPICTPPIIVGGIIYVPLMSGIGQAAPFVSAWLFEDRIDVFSTSGFPYGPWLGPLRWDEDLTTDEELANFPIIVNGIKIESPPAIFADESRRQTIMIPLVPVAEALGYGFIRDDSVKYLVDMFTGERLRSLTYTVIDGEAYVHLCWMPLNANGIVHDGQILIESRSNIWTLW